MNLLTKRSWLSFAISSSQGLFVAAAMAACSSSNSQPSGAGDSGSEAGTTEGGSTNAGPNDGGIADGPAGDGSTPIVNVVQGQLQGRVDGKVFEYLGIPYAQPPVGPLRWKAPQSPAAWSGVRDATVFGNRCAQNANPTLFTTASADEDCLYLNVWTPNPSASKLPVMVWIHGGGNVGGSASDPVPFSDGGYFYSGASLAADNVVVVSLNYRLGVFGFFAHPGLVDEGSKAGNQGLWDQRFAMEWVHTNISNFGGDPGNVTIFGESAGSLDVCLHEASPQTPPLFERAISESGGCTTRQPTLGEGQSLMLNFAAMVGCAGGAPTASSDAGAPDGGTDSASGQGGADAGSAEAGSSQGGSEAGPVDGAAGSTPNEAVTAMACLRNLPVATLLSMASASDAGGMLGPFTPVVDGDFLADQPRTLYKTGRIAKTPYLLGSNEDEGTLFVVGQTPVTDQAGLTSYIDQQYGDAGAAVAQLYPASEFDGGIPNPYQAALTRIVGDSILVCSTYDSALLAAAQGSPVYMYDFDIPVSIPGTVGPPPAPLYLGASHGSELSFVFGSSPQFATDMGQASISQIMERYWTRFAASGDPNGGSDLLWPKFSATSDERMQFTLMPSVVTGFRSAECMFWIGQYEAQFAAGP